MTAQAAERAGVNRMVRFRRRHHPLLAALREIRDGIEHVHRHVQELKEITVADATRTNQDLDRLFASIEGVKSRIAEDFQALKDQLANNPGDQVALDGIAARLEESIASLDTIDPDPNNPAPAPVPTPEPVPAPEPTPAPADVPPATA